MKNSMLGRSSLAIVFILAGYAQTSHAQTDLVGRNGQFTVTGKNGAVEKIDSKDLGMQKELMPSAPRAITESSTRNEAKGTASPKVATKPIPSLPAKPAAPPAETKEQDAVRTADVEQLRAMRKQGGAWFYTDDNKPVSFEEVDRRIATGEVEGLKAVGLHLEDWKPQTKSKTEVPSDSRGAPEPEPVLPEPMPMYSRK